MYLMVITTSFSIYYLPRLSEINDSIELKHEIFKCYKFIIPLLILVSFIIFILRDFVIWLLFSTEFYPMESLFGWQLAGDILKISSWLLAYVMVAKAMTRLFIATEILFTSSFLLLGLFLVKINGTIGLTQAYFFNYAIYMLAMLLLFNCYFKKSKI